MSVNRNSVAKTIVFSDFCDLLDDIKTNTKKQEQKFAKLGDFIKAYRAKGKELAETDPNVETTFFPVLRLLLPQHDRERGAYGLKHLAVAKSIIKILGLAVKSEDASVLKRSALNTNDFAEATYNILRKHFSGSQHLSISDINEKLDAIAKKNRENDIRGQEDEIFKLFKSTSPNEQRWLIRIILKELTLGLGQNKILRLYHPDAVDLFDSNNSLSKTCDTLHDPNVRISEIEISLFTPFRPMLSQRCDAKEFLRAITGDAAFLVETKYDGERFQLHMSDGKFKYFSRNGFDYTKKYGVDYSSGVFTPQLKTVFNSSVQSVILDGEMMGWNTVTKKFGSKGMNFDVKNLVDTSRYKPCFCVFDIIYLNKVVLTSKTFTERMEILESVLSPIESVIVISQKREAQSKQSILDALNTSMDNGEEGIVFKSPKSVYVPNNRKGGWWKLKLEYFSNVMTDLDVMIMGAYKNSNKVNGFLVGIAQTSKFGIPTKFLSLARISSGLNSKELESIEKKLGPHWKEPVDDRCERHGLYFGKDKPEVWIEPEKSCILVVRATELMKMYGSNPDYKAKYTLRFPRILSIRFDKAYHDCMTSMELDDLTAGTTSVEKLYKRHLELTDIESDVKKVKKRKARFQLEEADVGVVSSSFLKNYEFCVLTGTKDLQKIEIEKSIKENGGTVVKVEGQNTFCIIVGDDHLRIQYYKGSVDMVKLSWLQNILDKRKFRQYKPDDMIHTTSATRNRFMSEYDQYGDSYTEKATTDSLKLVFKKILNTGDYINPMSTEIDAFHDDISFPFQFGAFRGLRAYFDKYKVINEPESEKIFASPLVEAEFKFWGGTVSEYLSKEVNLVVIKTDSELRTEVISNYLNQICNKRAKIVTKDYIDEQVAEYKNC